MNMIINTEFYDCLQQVGREHIFDSAATLRKRIKILLSSFGVDDATIEVVSEVGSAKAIISFKKNITMDMYSTAEVLE